MTTVIDAINELIKSANVAQSRGAFTLKEAHDAYVAIDFINSAVTNQPAPPPATEPAADAKKGNKKSDY
jgi:hypothetical protein